MEGIDMKWCELCGCNEATEHCTCGNHVCEECMDGPTCNQCGWEGQIDTETQEMADADLLGHLASMVHGELEIAKNQSMSEDQVVNLLKRIRRCADCKVPQYVKRSAAWEKIQFWRNNS